MATRTSAKLYQECEIEGAPLEVTIRARQGRYRKTSELFADTSDGIPFRQTFRRFNSDERRSYQTFGVLPLTGGPLVRPLGVCL